MDEVEVPLRVSVVDAHFPQEDAAVQVPGLPGPGVPLDPAQVASLEHADDGAADYTNPSTLRAGDSGQTFVGVADAGPPTSLAGFAECGTAAGDAGGD